MNAPIESKNFYEEGESEGVMIINIAQMLHSRVEKIQSPELQRGMFELLKQIQDRMDRGDLGKALGYIHNIPLEYSLYEGIKPDDVSICNSIYSELLQVHDRLFMSMFPAQFRHKTDQILGKTPK